MEHNIIRDASQQDPPWMALIFVASIAVVYVCSKKSQRHSELKDSMVVACTYAAVFVSQAVLMVMSRIDAYSDSQLKIYALMVVSGALTISTILFYVVTRRIAEDRASAIDQIKIERDSNADV